MDTRELFNKRRSVNFFDKEKTLDNKLIKDIIDFAVLAPSAFNLQPWRLIIVKSKEAKQKLFELSSKQPKVLEASANIIIIGNREGYSEDNPVWDEMLKSVGSNKDMVDGAKNAAAFLYGSTDERKMKFAEMLAMSIMIAAKEFGVETHPMSGLDFDGIHKEFGLNSGEAVVMNIAIGYKDESKQLYPRRPRRGFDDIAEII